MTNDTPEPTSGGEAIRIRITGQGVDIDREIPVERLPLLLDLIMGGAGGAAAAGATAPPQMPVGQMPVGQRERRLSVAEYIRDKQPQTSPDTILVLAGYLELHENKRPFGRDDLRRVMRAGRLPDPSNFPRDVGLAVSKGYIQPLGDGFQLTQSGLELVSQAGPLVTPRGRPGPKPRRGSRGSDDLLG